MFPIAISLGRFTIYWYGIMAAVGFLLAAFIITRLRKYANMTSDQASGTIFVAIVSGIVGARLFYVIQFFDHYRDNLWNVFRIDQGGLVFYGGFLLAIAGLWTYCRFQKLDIVRVFDVYGPALAIAHACGRIGCFTRGCCFGKPTLSPFGVVFPPDSAAAARYGAEPVHPVQLYEAAENIVVFFLMLYLLRNKPRGTVLGAYLIVYGALRFINELFRGDNPHLWLFTPAQWIGLGLIPVGVILLIWFKHHARKNA